MYGGLNDVVDLGIEEIVAHLLAKFLACVQSNVVAIGNFSFSLGLQNGAAIRLCDEAPKLEFLVRANTSMEWTFQRRGPQGFCG